MSPEKTPEYPRKLYYSISEVAQIAGVKAHVLRYWETEFSTLRPKKTRTGSRRYRQVDIEEVLAIKSLLYDEGFRIAGARKVRLGARKKARQAQEAATPQLDLGFDGATADRHLELVKQELGEILALVREMEAQDTPPKAEKSPGPPLRKMKGEG